MLMPASTAKETIHLAPANTATATAKATENLEPNLLALVGSNF